MKWIALLLLLTGTGVLLLGIAGYRFTDSKLEKMEMIRGFQPRAIQREVIVTDKLSKEPPLESRVFWIAWNGADIRVPSHERLNLTGSHWNSIEVGDEFTVVFLEGDPSPYHADGIFASDGSFAFDKVLQIIEIVIACIGALLMLSAIPVFLRASRKSRAKQPAPPPLPAG